MTKPKGKANVTQNIVPSNSWRTLAWIKQAYGLNTTALYELRQLCLTSEYDDAIIQINQRRTFIVEDRWQQFLKSLSDKFKLEHYGI